MTVFLTRIDDRAAVNEVRKRYFGDARPASTLVQVSALVLPELLVEIEAVVASFNSAVPDARSPRTGPARPAWPGRGRQPGGASGDPAILSSGPTIHRDR